MRPRIIAASSNTTDYATANDDGTGAFGDLDVHKFFARVGTKQRKLIRTDTRDANRALDGGALRPLVICPLLRIA